MVSVPLADIDRVKIDPIHSTEFVIAPIYWYIRTTLTKPQVKRTFSTGGQEYFEKWDIALE